MCLNPVKRLVRVIVIVVLVSFDTLVIVEPAPVVAAFDGAIGDVVVRSDGTPVTGMGGFKERSRTWIVDQVLLAFDTGKWVDGPNWVGKPSGKIIAR